MTVRAAVRGWVDAVVYDLGRQLRWSFLPPLMVYFAYGFTGLTQIVGTFFVKDYLDLSAAFLAGLTFWAGLPWALKMPLGHLVDIMWRWKWVLVWIGAGLLALSVLIMYFVIAHRPMMAAVMPISAWYITSYLLAPVGVVLQDAVADAMSVEAVPRVDDRGRPLTDEEARPMHVTMQTLGRFALITGSVVVAALNIYMFSGIEGMDAQAKADIYARIYLAGLGIPVLSVTGVTLAGLQKLLDRRRLMLRGLSRAEARAATELPNEETRVNPWYFIGGAGFVAISLIVGLGEVPYGQEIIFAGSMVIVVLLMRQLAEALPPARARSLIGTAIIIFAFRATPRPGDGVAWFNIDVLGFDQQFLSVLSLITSVLALAGMVVLRPMMAHRPIVWVVVVLSIAAGVLTLPNIGLYYGIHKITAPLTWGIVDARFIAILDTAVESPLAQIAMIPMLAWIARNAPVQLKATFFAVMASFTNLALSASSLGTKYLNWIFTIERQVTDPETGTVVMPQDYSELGWLLITVGVLTTAVPLVAVAVIQRTRLRSID